MPSWVKIRTRKRRSVLIYLFEMVHEKWKFGANMKHEYKIWNAIHAQWQKAKHIQFIFIDAIIQWTYLRDQKNDKHFSEIPNRWI